MRTRNTLVYVSVAGSQALAISGQTEAAVDTVTTDAPVKFSLAPNTQQELVTVSAVTLQAAQRVDEASVSVAQVTAPPGNITAPPGKAVQLLRVTSSAPDSALERATLTLRVPRSAVADANALTVYRYTGAEWTALETTVANTTDTAVTLSATTSGFSLFAVISRQDGTSSQDTTPTATGAATPSGQSESSTDRADTSGSGSPGFTAVGLALAAVVSLLCRL